MCVSDVLLLCAKRIVFACQVCVSQKLTAARCHITVFCVMSIACMWPVFVLVLCVTCMMHIGNVVVFMWVSHLDGFCGCLPTISNASHTYTVSLQKSRGLSKLQYPLKVQFYFMLPEMKIHTESDY